MATKVNKTVTKEKVNKYIVSGAELGVAFGVTERSIRQFAKDGIIPKSQPGKYDLIECTKAYIEHIKPENDPVKKTKDELDVELIAEKIQHEKFKKKKTELVIKQMDKKLLDTIDVEYFWNAIILAAKSQFLALPRKAAPIVFKMNKSVDIQNYLKREIDDVLKNLANFDLEKFDKDIDDNTEDDD